MTIRARPLPTTLRNAEAHHLDLESTLPKLVAALEPTPLPASGHADPNPSMGRSRKREGQPILSTVWGSTEHPGLVASSVCSRAVLWCSDIRRSVPSDTRYVPAPCRTLRTSVRDLARALLRTLEARRLFASGTREVSMSETSLLSEAASVPPRLAAITPPISLQGGTTAVVVLRGEWDVSGRPALAEELSRLIARRDTDVLVDLSGVTVADTAILRVFAETQALLDRNGHNLTLRSPENIGNRALRLLGLTDLIETPDRLSGR